MKLALGQTVDTNSAYLAAELARLGVRVREQVTIGDDLEVLAEVLRRVGTEADVIIASGGLGPTDDDLTREAVAGVGDPTGVARTLVAADRGVFCTARPADGLAQSRAGHDPARGGRD